LHRLLGQSGISNHPVVVILHHFSICAIIFNKIGILPKKGNSMSGWLIIVTGLIYAYIAVEQYVKGNVGMAICYFGYAFGNVGLYMVATK
jgi:hypothetical protein